MTRYLFQYILVCFEGFVLWTLNVGSENIKEGLQGIKHHIWKIFLLLMKTIYQKLRLKTALSLYWMNSRDLMLMVMPL